MRVKLERLADRISASRHGRRRPAIHDFPCRKLASRGWCAGACQPLGDRAREGGLTRGALDPVAHHDDEGRAAGLLHANLTRVGRRPAMTC